MADPAHPHIRIVAIGDSTTAGTPAFASPVEVPPDGQGDERSQFSFWLMCAHPQWIVLNRGVNGERTDEILARFDRDVVAEKPSATIVIAGVNDVYQGHGVERVIAGLAALYQKAADARIPVVAGSIIPYNTATSEQNRRMHAINDWIRHQPSIVFADTRSAVADAERPDMLFDSPDGLHPTVDGYRRMADAIAPALCQALR